MTNAASMSTSSRRSMQILRGGSATGTPATNLSVWQMLRHGLPNIGQPREVMAWKVRNIPHLMRGLWRAAIARVLDIPHYCGQVSLVQYTGDGKVLDYGLASLRVVTTAGVNAIVSAINGGFTISNFKYHGFGTGTIAEAIGDTALGIELTTEYATDNTRPTGTQTTGATNNVYRTVATLSPDGSGTLAITEHGIFSATTAGTLLDRTVFSAVNLTRGSDSLQVTYDLTFSAGG